MSDDRMKIHEFATTLRAIPGLHLFRIFMVYTPITDINRLFNQMATREEETDLRELERLWDEFIQSEQENVEEGN
jgi:hypothetical protein